MAEIGKRIKERRRALGMTQEELAKKLGYTNKSTIAKIETGTNDIPQSKVTAFAQALETTEAYLMGWADLNGHELPEHSVIQVPILGCVAAGIPISAITNIVDWEEFDPGRLTDHEYFGLRIKGDSMYPDLKDGDYVICQVTNDADNGDICIVQVNGDEATCKKIRKRKDELELVPINTQYEPIIYTAKEVETLPVIIIGKVVESRRKF